MKIKKIIISIIASLSLMLPTSLAFAGGGDDDDYYQKAEGSESSDPELTIPVTMCTDGGQWTDIAGTSHDNGTFIITIPKNIEIENTKLGLLDIQENYTINVSGAISSKKSVHVESNSTQLACDTNVLNMSVTSEKNIWNSAECVGNINDSKLSGTDSNETLTISGIVTTLGTFHGTITYTATLKNNLSMSEALTAFANSEVKGNIGSQVGWYINDHDLVILPTNGTEGAMDLDWDNNNYWLDEDNESNPIKSVIILGKVKVDDCSGLFRDLHNVTDIDLTGLDTSEATSMNEMFAWCFDLKYLNVSNLDTSSVTDTSRMFYNCASLKKLDLTDFDTTLVEDMHEMFAYCYELSSLDVSTLATSNVQNMSGMFQSCEKVVELDLSSFNTSNVTTMQSMFNNCGIQELDLSTFETTKLENIESMFYNLKVTELDLSNFDTSQVYNMSQTFYGCRNLASLIIPNFTFDNVTKIDRMLAYCPNLTLNCSSWNVSEVTFYMDFSLGSPNITQPSWPY